MVAEVQVQLVLMVDQVVAVVMAQMQVVHLVQ